LEKRNDTREKEKDDRLPFWSVRGGGNTERRREEGGVISPKSPLSLPNRSTSGTPVFIDGGKKIQVVRRGAKLCEETTHWPRERPSIYICLSRKEEKRGLGGSEGTSSKKLNHREL